MKRLLVLLLLAIMMTSVIAQSWEYPDTTNPETLEIDYTGGYSLTLKEKAFYLPFSVDCAESSLCGGKIRVELLLTGGIEAEAGDVFTCYISQANRKCSYNTKFNFANGNNPTIQIKATTEAGSLEETDVISVKRYVGELVGSMGSVPSQITLYDEFDVNVEYECKKAVCLDVKIKLEHGDGLDVEGGTYSCGNMDHESNCKHIFKVEAIKQGNYEIQPTAIAFLPNSATNPDAASVLVEKTIGQQVEPIVPQQKNIFEIIWEWITGLFK